MTASDLGVLVLAGVLAGIVSAVVSLASVISYPALLALGLSPVAANVTNTVALVFTGIGSTAGSRPELDGQGGRVLRLGLATATGGLVGAGLLLGTPPDAFAALAPLLVACASVLILVQPRLRSGSGPEERSRRLMVGVFAAAVYIGYFGAAGGVLMLAVLGANLDASLARLTAVKNAVCGLANGLAAVAFAVCGPVHWASAIPLALGFLAGGWLGPSIVRRTSPAVLRPVIALSGLAVAAWLAADACR